jgi:hypothetical protein
MVSQRLRTPALRLCEYTETGHCGSLARPKSKSNRRWTAPRFAERHSVTRLALNVNFWITVLRGLHVLTHTNEYCFKVETTFCTDKEWCFDLGLSCYWSNVDWGCSISARWEYFILRKKWQQTGERCIIRSSIICIVREMLLGWINEGGRTCGLHGSDEKCMQNVRRKV